MILQKATLFTSSNQEFQGKAQSTNNYGSCIERQCSLCRNVHMAYYSPMSTVLTLLHCIDHGGSTSALISTEVLWRWRQWMKRRVHCRRRHCRLRRRPPREDQKERYQVWGPKEIHNLPQKTLAFKGLPQRRRVEGTGNSASVTPSYCYSTAVQKIYNDRGSGSLPGSPALFPVPSTLRP